ncbi:hypothetical protein COSHB9_08560 [Companilactobacillus alimentarius]|uniref:IrrE N-terminal-like domain-containing protein n=1 Tax=Companilactobacillus alimentarius DSM 20249 TaxID=1423720 RepID=A0A2K9HH02_9LACO|nr:hypothetical protein [Companilactobacillus alimentarius]AUI71821.1 hypothetical protein LA20249_06370 [Companilactobacillus alimentarius DSM 20249]KRK76914.1 hypothetical protein FC67_GL000465 [Companilactobacillus alimentarius DSM 20249]MDT6952345.1 hypothetical protein [Companilactobacillus alimentarius]GEO45184.1 hypothetical protein LAL01_14160 [Companilactobacillus alimentarius]
MKQIDNNDLSTNIVEQVQKIEQQYNKKIKIYSDYSDHEFLTLDQASHQIKGQDIQVVITNEKYKTFVLAHELYHIALELSDEPSISCAVTSGKQDYDGRILAVANSVFETLEHFSVMRDQQADGTYTDEIKAEYLKGIEAALHPKVELDIANMRFYRTLIIFDGIIFSNHANDQKWQEEFPKSFKYANNLVKIAEENDLSDAFHFRRALVNALDSYNEIILYSGYEGLGFHEFLNITPVLSKRQLRLSLNQVYQVKHSSFKNRATGKDAFVLLGLNDSQSVTTLDINPDKVTPEFYKAFYQYQISDVFKEEGVKYLIR